MSTQITSSVAGLCSVTAGVVETVEQGVLILSPADSTPQRRVLYVNSYGGPELWQKVKSGSVPPHHLWGCLELVRRGYAVAIAQPILHFCWRRNKFPHDLKFLPFARRWLGPDDIIYCAHTLLYWLGLLKRIGMLRCHLVSLSYAREDLDFARAHSAAVAMTPAAEEKLRQIAPALKVARLGWGSDLSYFPELEFNPQYFLSCGITNRDLSTLNKSARSTSAKIRLICPGIPADLEWPQNVEVTDGGKGWNVDEKKISFRDLLHDHYSGCSAVLILLKNDPSEKHANGFTNLLEAMAMGRPVIMTKTGAVPAEIDIEKAGCGIFVPPNSPEALAEAMNFLVRNPTLAQQMGERGRHLAESHYNIERYASDLHSLFESL